MVTIDNEDLQQIIDRNMGKMGAEFMNMWNDKNYTEIEFALPVVKELFMGLGLKYIGIVSLSWREDRTPILKLVGYN